MAAHLIEHRNRPGSAREVWAQRLGTKAEARRSAEGLLAELREDHPRAMVWLDGRAVRLPKPRPAGVR